MKYILSIFKHVVTLLSDANLCERLNSSDFSRISTGEIFLSYTKSVPPTKIELSPLERDWSLIWKRLCFNIFSPMAYNCLFLVVHEKVNTRERGHRLLGNN